MNRLAPLIARVPAGPPASFAPPPAWTIEPRVESARSSLAADLRLFLAAWLAGLIFFGTLLA